jgi:hypothetical protein
MVEIASASLSIDLSRIAAICEEEWPAFLDEVGIDPIPERQDLRAFFLNWVGASLSDVWSRVDQHPLFSSYVRLTRPAERNPNG